MQTGQVACFENAGFDVVVVAASLGGPQILGEILSGLPADFPTPILVAQHLSARFPSSLPELLGFKVLFRTEWAGQDARLRARTVYLAPPGRHLTVTPFCTARLSSGPRVSFAQPAADLLFSSAAESFGHRALGVVLTGRLHDGAAGAEAIRKSGGVVLAQAPHTCRAPSMPQTVIQRGAADFVLPPEKIACALVSLVMVPGARALFGLEKRSA